MGLRPGQIDMSDLCQSVDIRNLRPLNLRKEVYMARQAYCHDGSSVLAIGRVQYNALYLPSYLPAYLVHPSIVNHPVAILPFRQSLATLALQVPHQFHVSLVPESITEKMVDI